MARRINGGVHVRPRSYGGAVLTLKAATGEAFEIELSPEDLSGLAMAISEVPLAPQPEPTPDPETEAEPNSDSVQTAEAGSADHPSEETNNA